MCVCVFQRREELQYKYRRKNGGTHTHTHTYSIYIYMYIYIHFLSPCFVRPIKAKPGNDVPTNQESVKHAERNVNRELGGETLNEMTTER